MSLKKIGIAKYLVAATVRDKVKGYPISAQKTVVGSRAEAIIVHAKLLEKLRAKASSLKPAVAGTFGEAVDIYLDKLRATGRESKSYLHKVGLLRRELGHISLEEFPDRLDAFVKAVRITPKRGGKPSKGAMASTFIVIARAVFNHLLELEIVDRNPIRRGRFPIAKPRSRNRFLTQEEQLRLFAAIKEVKPALLPLISYLAVVPSRVSELTTARREQYSPITNTIFIPDSKADISIYKPVPEGMVEYFRNIPADCPYLFYWQDWWGNYKPWYRFAGTWNRILRTAGIADFHVHDLRHMAATSMINAGNPKQAVMLVAGWKTDMLGTYYNNDSLTASQSIKFG